MFLSPDFASVIEAKTTNTFQKEIKTKKATNTRSFSQINKN